MKVAFETLGCRSNYADSVEIQTALVAKGLEITNFQKQADIYVLNTCTVTNAADLEAYRILRRIRNQNPQARIVVTGCLAELGFNDLKERQVVDAIVTHGDVDKMIDSILDYNISLIPSLANTSKRSSTSINYPLSPRTLGPGESLGDVQMRARFHLRIQDGCNHFCSYCIVPFARGNPISRDPNLIIRDLQTLCDKGYEEIVLSGTHLGLYGKDLGISLFDLLRQIAQLDLNCRIRISSLDPNELSQELISFLSETPIFCEHLHLCFQSFSNKLLKRMNRKYTTEEVENNIKNVHKLLSGWCIGSDLIVGFPGESREDVDQAMKSFLDLPISYLHVFPYSERRKTKAVDLDGSVPIQERRDRAGRWRRLSTTKRNQYLARLVGKSVEIIVERKTDQTTVIGTSREYALCEMKISHNSNRDLRIGTRQIAKVVSVNTEEESLICEL